MRPCLTYHMLPYAAFDLVLCQQGLRFFPDRAAAVREVQRVLRSGGRFVLNVWQSTERQPVYNTWMSSGQLLKGIARERCILSSSLAKAQQYNLLRERRTG